MKRLNKIGEWYDLHRRDIYLPPSHHLSPSPALSLSHSHHFNSIDNDNSPKNKLPIRKVALLEETFVEKMPPSRKIVSTLSLSVPCHIRVFGRWRSYRKFNAMLSFKYSLPRPFKMELDSKIFAMPVTNWQLLSREFTNSGWNIRKPPECGRTLQNERTASHKFVLQKGPRTVLHASDKSIIVLVQFWLSLQIVQKNAGSLLQRSESK